MLGLAIGVGVLAVAPIASGATAGSWTSWGQNTSNTRSAASTIGVGNAGSLAQKWKLSTAGAVSATPAVENGVVYAPDTAGNFYAVNAATGAVIWQKNLSTDYQLPAGDYARATPAIAGNILVFGDQAGKVFSPDGYLLGVDKRTGALAWKTTITGGYPIMTQSPTVVNGVAYVGVASYEELLVRFGVPLSFRGQMMAVNTATGQILWKTYTVPEGYTGGAVWGSSPAVDTKAGTVYIATGNNYSVPDSVTTCITDANGDQAIIAACAPAADMFDSIVALNMNTGAVKWSFRAIPSDAWNVSCGIPFPGFEDPVAGCPSNQGPDYDFGQAPMLWKANGTQFVGAGQKSGMFWALDAGTGALRWSTQAGPGGVGGGLQWGSSTDGTRIYIANANSEAKPWTLANGTTVTSGGWAAYDAASGRLIWQRANPTVAGTPGPTSVANGVLYGCSADADGHQYALKASDGTILKDITSGDFCYGGASIVDGTVYWGTGYAQLAPDTDPDRGLAAFTVNGK
jgi:polyvinyl alcohol dehydrogenase (cytochrome)